MSLDDFYKVSITLQNPSINLLGALPLSSLFNLYMDSSGALQVSDILDSEL